MISLDHKVLQLCKSPADWTESFNQLATHLMDHYLWLEVVEDIEETIGLSEVMLGTCPLDLDQSGFSTAMHFIYSLST